MGQAISLLRSAALLTEGDWSDAELRGEGLASLLPLPERRQPPLRSSSCRGAALRTPPQSMVEGSVQEKGRTSGKGFYALPTTMRHPQAVLDKEKQPVPCPSLQTPRCKTLPTATVPGQRFLLLEKSRSTRQPVSTEVPPMPLILPARDPGKYLKRAVPPFWRCCLQGKRSGRATTMEGNDCWRPSALGGLWAARSGTAQCTCHGKGDAASS